MAKQLVLAVSTLVCGGLAGCGPAEGPVAETPAVAEPASVADAAAGVALPLKRGFYVATEVSCSEASNATLQLFRGNAMSTSHVVCEFNRIEEREDAMFDVTMTCTDDGGSFGGEDVSETHVETFDIRGEDAFKQSTADGWGAEFAFCDQSSLPEPWRDNDISDLIR